jgi:deoxyribose-phosphate aldolase
MNSLMPLEFVHKIEYLLLDPQLSRAEIEAGCETAKRFDCYAVVVKPHYIEAVRKALKDSRVKIISVVGFPHGGATTATKGFETQDLLQRGADEIEMVINLGALRDGEDLVVKNDIVSVVKVARGHPITVILETSCLTDDQKIRGCKIIETAGASFIKTGTDFYGSITSANDVKLLRATQPNLPVKAASGIDTRQAVEEMLAAGAVRVATRLLEKIANED